MTFKFSVRFCCVRINCHHNDFCFSRLCLTWGGGGGGGGGGGHFKNTYELFNLRALKFSTLCKIIIFQCMVKIFCVEFQREPLKFYTKYPTHTMKDFILIQHWNFKSSQISKLISVFETPPWDIWDNESIGLTKCTGWPLVIITQGYICGTDLPVCTIKWEPLIQSLQNLIAISPWRCLLLDEILEKFCWKLFFGHFFFTFLHFGYIFSRSNTIGHILSLVGLVVMQ